MKVIPFLLVVILLIAGCAPAPDVAPPTAEGPLADTTATPEVSPSPVVTLQPTAGPGLAELMATPSAYYQGARLDEAAEAYLDIAALYPASAEPLLGLAAISLRVGDYEAAEGWIRNAIAVDPASIEAWRQLAVLQMTANDWEALRETFTALIDLAPSAELYRARAIASARLADPDSAITDLTMADTLEPLRADGWARAAGAAASLRDSATALAIAEAGLALQPGDVSLLYARGLACLSACDDETALAAFDDLLAASPGHTGGHFWRGRLLDRMGDLEGALAEAEAAAESGISSGITDEAMAFEAFADAADLITRLQDANAAFEYVAQQVFIYGSRDELLLAYARIDWRRGSVDAALDRLAVLAANGYHRADYWAGVIAAEAGETEMAVASLTAFTSSVTYGPEAEAAFRLLAELGA